MEKSCSTLEIFNFFLLTVPSTLKVLTSWWVLAIEIERILIYLLNCKSVELKPCQLIDIVMGNIFEKDFV